MLTAIIPLAVDLDGGALSSADMLMTLFILGILLVLVYVFVPRHRIKP